MRTRGFELRLRSIGFGGSNSGFFMLEDGSGFMLLEDGTTFLVFE